jgi:hypothetical protein
MAPMPTSRAITVPISHSRPRALRSSCSSRRFSASSKYVFRTRVVSPSTEESPYCACGPFGGFCNLEPDVFEQGRPGGQLRLQLLDERGGLLQAPRRHV